MFDFPSPAPIGESIVAPNGASFVWDGMKWTTPQNAAAVAAGITASVVNVLDHGAKGDGTTDDTAAIQGVLNVYAGKATVFVPNTGHPYIVGPLNVLSNTDLIIDGTLLLRPSSQGPVLAVNSHSNVTIHGNGTVDGNAAAQAVVGSGAPSGVGVQNSSDVRISDITIQHALLWNLNVVQSTNIRVDKVTMLNCTNANEFAQGCDNCWLTGCYINGVTLDEGFSFYGGVTNSGAIGNTVTNAGADGINVLNDSAQPAACSNITISDNICHGNNGSGIQVNIGVGATATHSGIIITSNRCYANCMGGEGGVHLYVASVFNVLISDNMVSGDGTYGATAGIEITSNVTAATITGNAVYNIGDAAQPGTGLYVGGSNIVLAASNMFHDFRPTSYMSGIGGAPGIKNSYLNNSFGVLVSAIGFTSVQPDTAIFNPIGRTFSFGQGLPTNAANDAAAASAGVPVGGVYRAASALMVRTV